MHTLEASESTITADLAVTGTISGQDLAVLGRFEGELQLAGHLRTGGSSRVRSEEHTSELQSPYDLVCRLLLEKKKKRVIQQWTEGVAYSSLPLGQECQQC